MRMTVEVVAVKAKQDQLPLEPIAHLLHKAETLILSKEPRPKVEKSQRNSTPAGAALLKNQAHAQAKVPPR